MITFLENINISVTEVLSNSLVADGNNDFIYVLILLIKILIEASFAGISALGFALISDPPKRYIIYTVLLAAVGRGFRYSIMAIFGMGIVMSTFIASIIIGLLGIYIANRVRCSMEVISFPALLPMIPGVYAYKTIIAFVLYGQAITLDDKHKYLINMFDNGVMGIAVVSALAIGVTVPFLMFYEKSFTLTRKKQDEAEVVEECK